MPPQSDSTRRMNVVIVTPPSTWLRQIRLLTRPTQEGCVISLVIPIAWNVTITKRPISITVTIEDPSYISPHIDAAIHNR